MNAVWWLVGALAVAASGDEGDVIDAQEIVDRLWLGSCAASHDETFLRDANISLVISVAPSSECAHQPFVNSIRLDLLDDGRHSIAPFLPMLVREIDAALAANRSVLAHCRQGISRSPAVILAYLMLSRRMTLRAALSLVKAKRDVLPRFQLFEELMEIEQSEHGHSTVSHRDNYVPILLGEPPGPVVVASCDSPLAAAPELLAGATINEYLLTELVHDIHAGGRDCRHCIVAEPTTSLGASRWPRCPLRSGDDVVVNDGEHELHELAVFEPPEPFFFVERVAHGSFGEVWRGIAHH